MGREGIESDARRAYRVASVGVAASCYGNQFFEQYQVENLSAGGALLSSGRMAPLGKEVSLKLLLPDHRSLELEARVVRHHTPHLPVALAVEFDPISSEQADALHDVVADTILREWDPENRSRHRPVGDVLIS